MTNAREYLMNNRSGLTVTNSQSTDLSAAYLRMNKCWKTNFNKTWHADCRDKAVSKILDWLVK